jgi:2-phospho-L-lactate guanylyltransferase (CobY/MobA/RfbA family)
MGVVLIGGREWVIRGLTGCVKVNGVRHDAVIHRSEHRIDVGDDMGRDEQVLAVAQAVAMVAGPRNVAPLMADIPWVDDELV